MKSLTRREAITGAAALTAALTIPAISVEAAVPVAVQTHKKWIMPSLMYCERQTQFAEENCYTIIYEVMERWEEVPKTEKYPLDIKIMTARVDSDRYRQWLAEIPPEDGIPPHIQFGGAVVAGKGDPTFKSRWEERTRAHLASGRLV